MALFATVMMLAVLLVLNSIWATSTSLVSRRRTTYDWAFLIISAALVLAKAGMSDLFELAYLLAVVCGQVGMRRGVWPAGVVFRAALMAGWLGLQLALGLSLLLLGIWTLVHRAPSVQITQRRLKDTPLEG